MENKTDTNMSTVTTDKICEQPKAQTSDSVKNQKNREDNRIKNDRSQNFKLLTGTKFCSSKKVGGPVAPVYPLVLEQDITFNGCNGLKVRFMGQVFCVTENTESDYKFNFAKGTIYTLETDQIGLIQSLNHSQDFKVQNGTKIEVPIGTVLVSDNKEQDISITLNHRMILEIIS